MSKDRLKSFKLSKLFLKSSRIKLNKLNWNKKERLIMWSKTLTTLVIKIVVLIQKEADRKLNPTTLLKSSKQECKTLQRDKKTQNLTKTCIRHKMAREIKLER